MPEMTTELATAIKWCQSFWMLVRFISLSW